jgi:hypothetical protein
MVLELNFYFLAYWLFSVTFMVIYISIKYNKTIEQINTHPQISMFLKVLKNVPQYNQLVNKIKSPSVFIMSIFVLFVTSPIFFPIALINIFKNYVLGVTKLKAKVKELEAKIAEMEKALEDAKKP